MTSGRGILHELVERGQPVARVRDRLVGHRDQRVLEDRLPPLGVVHLVRGDPAVLHHHPLDELDGDAGRLGVLERDDALLAHAVQRAPPRRR